MMNHWPGTNIPISRRNAFDVAFGTSTLSKDGGVKYTARKARAATAKSARQRNAETVEFKRVALVGQRKRAGRADELEGSEIA